MFIYNINLLLIGINMFNFNNFVPTDIFKKDREGNNIYFIFGKLGKGYKVEDSKVESRLIDLEGYKYFFFPIIKNLTILKSGYSFIVPPIVIPAFVKAFLVVTVLDLTMEIGMTEKTMWSLLFFITITTYFLSLYIYLGKLKKPLKNCEVISKEDKEWIFSQDEIPNKTFKSIELTEEERDNLNKTEKRKSIFKIYAVFLFLFFVFGLLLKQGFTYEQISISFKGNYHIVSLKENPEHFIFAMLFSFGVIVYSIYNMIKKFRLLMENIKFKWIYIFYLIAFFVISFPLWFVLLGIIL